LAAINGHDAVGREAQSQPAASALAASAAAAPTPAAVSTLAAPAPVPAPNNRIEAKLKSIVVDEVKPMENLPLSELVRWLNDQALRRDPEGAGVDFLMDFKQPSSPAPGAVDPKTGLPLSASAQAVDLGSVGIKIPFPLHKVTLGDMLDILLKASDAPIQYTVEEYGVLFSLKPQTSVAEPKPVLAAAAPERLSVRTFKVDTNTVLAALEHTFDISAPVPSSEGVDARSRAIQHALCVLFDVLGVRLGANSVFYNGLTGVLMVRAIREDMEVVSAAMETLTGLEPKRDPLQPEAGAAEKGSRSGVSNRPSRSGAGSPAASPEAGPKR
jgi:hypothetical protein